MASAVLMAVRAMAAAIAVVLMLVLAVMMGTRGQDTILQGAVQKRLHGGANIAGGAGDDLDALIQKHLLGRGADATADHGIHAVVFQKAGHGGMAAAGSIEQYRIGGGFALYGKHCKGRAFAKVLKHLAILCGNCKFHI